MPLAPRSYRLSLPLCAALLGCGEDETTSVPRIFEGSDDALVNDLIPDLPLPPGDGADVSVDPLLGLHASRTRLLVAFRPDATVGAVNQLLAGFGAGLAGTLPAYDLVVLAIPDTGDFTALHAAHDTLRASALVGVAAEDIGLSPTIVSAPSDAETSDPAETWRWGAAPADGSWGLEAARLPQAWNLLDEARRRTQDTGPPGVALIDIGFDDSDADGKPSHPDLATVLDVRVSSDDGTSFTTGGYVEDLAYHGTEVASVLGGRFDDSAGVTGAYPLVSYASGRFIGIADRAGPANDTPLPFLFTNTIADLARVVVEWPDTRIVNISMGYGWAAADPPWHAGMLDEPRTRAVEEEAAAVRRVMDRNKALLLVTTTGNDASSFPGQVEVHGMFSGPFQAAALYPGALADEALEPATNVLVIESVNNVVDGDGHFTKADSSQVGGQLAAPGGLVMTASPQVGFTLARGTSVAAPLVSGVAAYLLALDDFDGEELAELLTGISQTRVTGAHPTANETMPAEVSGWGPVSVAGSAAMIDAFAAVLAIDVLRGNRRLQAALVNVDDGTRDGNLRKRPFDDDPDPDDIHTGDGRRGSDWMDPSIDMRDFRAFRDAWVTANVALVDRLLDGEPTHFKNDLNYDGAIEYLAPTALDPIHPIPDYPTAAAAAILNAAPEAELTRYDFNGDGQLSNEKAPFKVDPDSGGDAGQLRDVDVMAEVWIANAEGENVSAAESDSDETSFGDGAWNRTALLRDRDGDGVIDYLRSVDLHLRLPQEGASIDLVAIGSPAPPPEAVIWRKGMYNPGAGTYTLTVPIFGSEPFKIFVRMRNVADGRIREVNLPMHPLVGEDLVMELDWGVLDLRSVGRGANATLFVPAEQQEITFDDQDTYGHPMYVTGELGTEAAAVADLQAEAQDLADASELGNWLDSFGAAVTPLFPTPYPGGTVMGTVDGITYPLYAVYPLGSDPVTYTGELFVLIANGSP